MVNIDKALDIFIGRANSIAPKEQPVSDNFDIFDQRVTPGGLLDQFNDTRVEQQAALRPGMLRVYQVGDFAQVSQTFEACEIVADSLNAAKMIVSKLEERGEVPIEEALHEGRSWTEIVPITNQLIPFEEAEKPVIIGEVILSEKGLIYAQNLEQGGVTVTAIIKEQPKATLPLPQSEQASIPSATNDFLPLEDLLKQTS